MKTLLKTKDFTGVKNLVRGIKNTENSYFVRSMSAVRRHGLLNLGNYSDYGVASAGVKLGFPVNFMTKYYERHPDGCERVFKDLYTDVTSSMKEAKEKGDSRKSTSLLVRDFGDKHCAILTDKYSIFDDDEVVDILSENDYLMDSEEFWYSATPERFHARFISKKKLYIDGDSSPLSMAVFVDNSMCGQSSFKIRFGIYRWACTNGMITGLKEFEIVKEAHKGKKDYVKIVASALSEAEQYEAMLLDMVQEAANTKSKIYDLDEEQALAYIQKKLNVGKNASCIILDNYRSYGGNTKWDLTNAITDYAHAVDLTERIRLENTALKVA